jgi:hypothetical protein
MHFLGAVSRGKMVHIFCQMSNKNELQESCLVKCLMRGTRETVTAFIAGSG